MTAKTDAMGRIDIGLTFTRGYVGFPTSPVSFQVSWKLLLRDKHNPSGGYLFVNNTDVANATIDAGVVEVPSVFRSP
jgi:hypothetical protein